MRKIAINMILELAKKNDTVFFIGSDLSDDILKQFKKEMPGRFFMEGISEANIIGMAAGLALEGKIVYVNTIATFLTRRCFEQIVVDLCLHKANVRLIANGGGLVYAPLGPTHQAIDDLGILRAIPNMTIVAPADALEMKKIMELTLHHKGPVYIRVAKGNDPLVTDEKLPIEIGKAVQVREGKDALVVTTGITLKIAMDAADELKKEGLNVAVLHHHTLKPLDENAIRNYAAKVPVVVSIEEHTIIGGLGSATAEILAEANFPQPKKFKRIAIPDVFADEYGSQASLMKKYSITTENLIKTIKELRTK